MLLTGKKSQKIMVGMLKNCCFCFCFELIRVSENICTKSFRHFVCRKKKHVCRGCWHPSLFDTKQGGGAVAFYK